MTDPMQHVIDWADPTTEPFWNAARKHQLVIQRCTACLVHQFYPRPFCLACDSDDVQWVPASGLATVYSRTVVHLKASPELGLESPYVVAIVELEEGPRLLTNLTSETCGIGDRVRVEWRERPGGQPPVPVFGAIEEAGL